jgi:hypothetical protein
MQLMVLSAAQLCYLTQIVQQLQLAFQWVSKLSLSKLDKEFSKPSNPTTLKSGGVFSFSYIHT